MGNTWQQMSAAELGRAIASGEIDPVELTEIFLDACANSPVSNEIYSKTTPDRARHEARAAAGRARSKQRLSPLDGVPVSWKDLFDSAGTETEAGSLLLKDRVPEHDAEVLRSATQAGLICLGKTHMSELAFSGLGLNPVTATPPCINNPDAVPGGSSSGAATSVAFGLAAGAIGSDTGGSVRIPAVWNDLVGLKTTEGRLSSTGVVPLSRRFDTVGPICRTTEDASLLLAAMEGSKPADLRGSSLDGARLLILENVALDAVRDAPAQAFDQALRRLEAAGAKLVRTPIDEVTEAMSLSGVLYATEAYAEWKDIIEAQPDLMFAPILERFRGGKAFSGTDYIQAWIRLEQLRRGYLQKTAEYDAVIMPTCPNLPPDRQRLLEDDDYYTTENLLALRNTRIGNLMGLCALTLPAGAASCGLMLQSAPGQEERLLRLGQAAEAALA